VQALFELTDGFKKLKEIVAALPADSPHWNEAQNRFQFIDRLLTECLGWEREYMEVEIIDDLGGRADYILGKPAKAILEAKKEAKLFEVPPGVRMGVLRSMAPLLASCKNFSSAVYQVIPYCSIRGTPVAIICNGPQLAIFQAVLIGQSPLSGECYFFNGFEAYLTHFPVLWRLLSPEGISENRALRELSLHRNPRIPLKASNAIIEPTKYRYRSPFQENLRTLASFLLEEIEDDPSVKHAFYNECYVSMEANNRHLLLSKRIIEAKYNRVNGDGTAPSSIESVTQINNGNVQISDPSFTFALAARPVVVVGDVGVGKTSFFENLFESLENSEKAQSYFVHVNLGIKATLSSDIKTYVLDQIPSVLNSHYGVDINEAEFVRAIYHAELKAFDRSIKGSLKDLDDTSYRKARLEFLSEKVEKRDSHLHASLGHLAHGRHKQIILVLDNADQRSFAVQQEAFLIAQELAATRNLLVFVALRPSTFFQSKTTGALAGYQNKVLTIAPPPADEVLQRRIAFAVRVAEGKVAQDALRGIRLQVGGIVSFLNATLRSIKSNQQIRQFLSNITGGNTRSVIELITGFCGSPNVDSEKIVEIERRDGDYKVPLHEFTKHALLGDYAYFHPQSSMVAFNIFDVTSADPREHFLASLIISFIGSSAGMKDNDGFVDGLRILHEMLSLNFSDDQTRQALRRLASRRLIETPHAHYREIEVQDHEPAEQFHYRATSIGVYHVRFWTGAFSFLDATAIDTPVFEPVARGEIFDLAESFEIADRYKKAVCFRKYLEDQWHLANIAAMYLDFPSLIKSQDESFLSVAKHIERAAKFTGSGTRRR
jgi:GTPase SAR1 family protein